jgi:hypothetical protein
MLHHDTYPVSAEIDTWRQPNIDADEHARMREVEMAAASPAFDSYRQARSDAISTLASRPA